VQSRRPMPNVEESLPPNLKTDCRVLGGIPARYGSSRLDGKPLVRLGSRTLIEHIHDRCLRAETVDDAVVATDDERIARAVRDFGGKVVMTSANHRTGTDRLAEVASQVSSEIVVNTQCDSPLFPPEAIDLAVQALLEDPSLKMSTVAAPSRDEDEIRSANSVKVVTDVKGDALYFSRSRLPGGAPGDGDILLHIGIYVYRREFLLELAGREQTPLEKKEHLEQLRVLEYGDRIRVVRIAENPPGVHDMADVEMVRKLLEKQAGG